MRSIKSDDDALLLLGAPWGAVFLGEKVAVAMAGGGTALLLGVALTTGMLRFGRAAPLHSIRPGKPDRKQVPMPHTRAKIESWAIIRIHAEARS